MNKFDCIGSGIGSVVNLSEVPTSEALAVASLCESVKVKIVNLTPLCGPVTIPVCIIDARPMSYPMEYLEEVVACRIATKQEFRLLRKLCALLR